ARRGLAEPRPDASVDALERERIVGAGERPAGALERRVGRLAEGVPEQPGFGLFPILEVAGGLEQVPAVAQLATEHLVGDAGGNHRAPPGAADAVEVVKPDEAHR